MKRIKLAVIAGGALFAAPVLAQDAPDPMADPSVDPAAETGTGMEAGVGMEAGTGMEGTAPVDASVSAVVPNWPQSAIDRPYVRPAGKISALAELGVLRFEFTNPLDPTMSTSITGDFFSVGGAYGVTDQITAGATYGFTPGLIGDADGDLAGVLDLFGGYQLVHSAKMSITATADFAVNLSGDETLLDLSAGLGARYNLAPQMALFTGSPYGPFGELNIVGASQSGAGAVGRHLSISFNDGPIAFDVPIGFMYQATPQFNVNAQTAVARIAFNDAAGDTIIFGADYIPLALGALFTATPNIDVVGKLALPDLKEAGFDLLIFTVGARYHN